MTYEETYKAIAELMPDRLWSLSVRMWHNSDGSRDRLAWYVSFTSGSAIESTGPAGLLVQLRARIEAEAADRTDVQDVGEVRR